jgi:16S rRNA (guanine966-N2)-methyltransferase
LQIIAGLYKSRKIQAPKGEKTRPSSGRLREALFNICQNKMDGAIFLDLFAGSGAMGIEALSRGARHATFVDNSRESTRCILSNLNALGISKNGDVVYSDVFDAMRKLAKRNSLFDFIYADPPYETYLSTDQGEKAYSISVLLTLDRLIEAQHPLLAPHGSLFIEEATGIKPEEELVKHLVLKDTRNMGRSLLQEWVRK